MAENIFEETEEQKTEARRRNMLAATERVKIWISEGNEIRARIDAAVAAHYAIEYFSEQ